MKGKIVRRLAAAGLSAVVAASAAAPVFAADKSYKISAISDMNITLPDNITVIDRDAPDSAEYFKLFGVDYNTVMSQMNSNNVYLQGMDNTASLTVTVSMSRSADSQEIENYNLLSSEQLGELGRNFLGQPEYTACRVDDAGKAVTWLNFDTSIGGVKAYLANTVYDGMSINVTVQRSGADATEEDYTLFTTAVSSVHFGNQGFLQKYWMCFAIAAAALMVILVLMILIIRTVRSIKSKKKLEKENDKILEELSGKYSRRNAGKPVQETGDNPAATKVIPVQNKKSRAAEPAPQPLREEAQTPGDAREYDPDEPRSKFTDAQLAEILGEEFATDEPAEYAAQPVSAPEAVQVYEEIAGEEAQAVQESIDDVPQPEPEQEPVTEAVPTDVEDDEDDEDDFFAGATFTDGVEEDIYEPEAFGDEVPDEAEEPVKTAEPDAPGDVETEESEEAEEVEEVEAAEEIEEAAQTIEAARPARVEPEPVDEPVEEAEEEPEEPGEPVEEEAEEEEEEEEETEEAEQTRPSDDGEPDELEEYMNDEVLVRENAKSNKFKDSSDFFDEAPRKSMGVLNSRDIADAEEYDVIGEEEKRAEAVKRDAPAKKKTKKKKGGGFKKFAAGFFGGLKYFFVHCGYFIINVSRAIKRRHKMKKRKKAEEERRRRARERAAKQRAMAAQRERQQRENGGLVQVHSRDDRRPPSSAQRRPSGSQQRRPSGSTQRRPSGSQQRRPSGSPQKRRPSGSPQKRRPSGSQQKRRPPERR